MLQQVQVKQTPVTTLPLQVVRFHEARYDLIRATATLLIVIWHINTTCMERSINLAHPVLNNANGTINAGAVGVVLFFLLSGALMAKKYVQDFDRDAFLKKRFTRFYIPHVMSYGIMYVVCFILTPDYFLNTGFFEAILGLLGLAYFSEPMWTRWGIAQVWLVGEWFTTVILLLYVLFPVIRFLFIRFYKAGTTLVTTLFLLNLYMQFMTYGGGWFSLTNALFCFWLGMSFEKWRDSLISPRVLVVAVTICVLTIVTNPAEIFGIAQLPSHILGIFLFICLFNFDYSNPLINYISKYSYEVYLIHHRIFILAIPFLIFSEDSFIHQTTVMIILIFTTFLFAEKLQKLTQKVLK